MAKFYLTGDRLRANGACEVEVQRFERVFGIKKQVAVNTRNFNKAVEARLPIWWLACLYLPWDEFRVLDAGDDDAPTSPKFELAARRYWVAIKAKMASDNDARPEGWY